MKNRILVLVVAFFLVAFNALGQIDTSKVKILSFVPQYLINKGIRVDYEIRIKNNHWLQLCPQYYTDEKDGNEDYEYDYNEVAGLGLQAYHKIFLNKDYNKLGTYFSYGLAYYFFGIKFDENFEGANTVENTYINKFGADVIIGYQSVIMQKMVLDIYAGLGSRYSLHTFSGNTKPKYNDSYWSYGYTGNIMLLGFRLGINL